VTYVIEDGPGGADLVVTGEWSSTAHEAIVDGLADGLVLNYARGFQEQSIDFIYGLPIKRLNLLARTVHDLSPVYSTAAVLEELRVQCDPSAVIELERLPHLRRLSASWPQVQGSVVFAQRLEHLYLGSYNETDLTPLSTLSALTSLTMKDRPRLSSLAGVEAFPWLAQLGIHLALNLEDISALATSASPVLTTLQLPACKKVVDIWPVTSCPSLRFFELSDGADIPTIRPLAGLTRLERVYLYGSTRVTDGDLRAIAGLPALTDFRMVNRPNYKPSVIEIQESIVQRR
jgi:hypothetical protein